MLINQILRQQTEKYFQKKKLFCRLYKYMLIKNAHTWRNVQDAAGYALVKLVFLRSSRLYTRTCP